MRLLKKRLFWIAFWLVLLVNIGFGILSVSGGEFAYAALCFLTAFAMIYSIE